MTEMDELRAQAARIVEQDGEDALIHHWDQGQDLSACGVNVRITPYTFGSPEIGEVTCPICLHLQR